VALVSLMLLIGKLRPLPSPWVPHEAKAVDMTPWRYAKLAAILLVILVILIYAAFADFSVLGKV